MGDPDKTRRIAELNDRLRSRLQVPVFGNGHVPGAALITRGIADLDPVQQIEILARVPAFDGFTEENGPCGEHDFGAFDYPGVGRVFWKIGIYADATCRYGSEYPADPKKSYRVLTVMLAEEY